MSMKVISFLFNLYIWTFLICENNWLDYHKTVSIFKVVVFSPSKPEENYFTSLPAPPKVNWKAKYKHQVTPSAKWNVLELN